MRYGRQEYWSGLSFPSPRRGWGRPNFCFDDCQDCGGQGRSCRVRLVVLTTVTSLAKTDGDALFLARDETLSPGDLNMVGSILEKPEESSFTMLGIKIHALVLPKFWRGVNYHLHHWNSESLSNLPNGHSKKVEWRGLGLEPAWPKMCAYCHSPPALLLRLHLSRMLQLHLIIYMILLEHPFGAAWPC